MIRNPRRAPHITQRPSEGMPPGGWAAADLNLPVWWYDQLVRTATGCEYPISGDQKTNKDAER